MSKVVNEDYGSVALKAIKPHPENPRQGDVGAIFTSIEANGFYGACVVQRSSGYILAGNHRYLAAKEAGMAEVPVIYVDVDDATAKRILLADNRTSDVASYDTQALVDILQELPDLYGTGYDQDALDQLLEDLKPLRQGNTDPDEVPEVPKDPVTKPGDLWLLGEHRVLCGDSTKAEDVERLMDGRTDALLATDPPYGVDYGSLVGSRKNQKKGGWADITNDALTDDELGRLLKGSFALSQAPVAFVWHPAGARRFLFWEALEANGWRLAQEIVWVKNALVFGRADYQWRHEPCLYAKRGNAGSVEDRTQTTVWEVPKPTDSDHPTQKPVELYRRQIVNHTKRGEVVYDPFAGSGSAVIAASELDRKAHCVEIEPAYVDVIVKRWEDFTGEKAVRS